MDVIKTLKDNSFVLTEAAVIEALSRTKGVQLHPRLEHALLIYDPVSRIALGRLYNSFISTAYRADVPVLITTPTWRANRERVFEEKKHPDVNRDTAVFLNEIREQWGSWGEKIGIGGFIGCRNDCYRPAEGLSLEESEAFHSWQIGEFACQNIDFLLAATLPAVPEAAGMALVMEKTTIPFILSFVIGRDGNILDGTRLDQAIDQIDSLCRNKPLGYMVNCAYPSFLKAETFTEKVLSRLIGYQANASSRDHADLDGAETQHAEDIRDWGNGMVALNKMHKIKILGGCCGTRVEHLEYIIDNL